MRWQFWKRPRNGKLPERVRKALETQFRLDAQTLDRLCCVGKASRFVGRPVRYIRIFDRSLVQKRGKAIRGYADVMARKEALLFEGHIESGAVYLLDRRPGKAAKPVKGTASPG